MPVRMKRYRVSFPELKIDYEVEAMNRPRALMKGLELLRADGHAPAETNTTEQRPGWSKESAEGSGYTQSDTTCRVYCLDEPAPSAKYDEQGHLRKVPPGKRHPAPISASGGIPAPALPAGIKGRLKGST